jgi:hypothetical protein
MKKLFLLLVLITWVTLPLISQTQRMVLIEEATNASCGPCASQNPAFDALLNNNRDKLTAVKYHWYFPGYDPMHNHNVAENNARVSYYGINGVPTATIDGVIENRAGFGYPGAPSGYTQQIINEYYAEPASFEIDLYHEITPAEDSIHIWMRIRAAEDITTSSLRAHIVVVEKEIHFSNPPGSNGEKDFMDVMKKMLPNAQGTSITGHWQEGEYLILKESWKLQNIYDMDQVGVVGFVQHNTTKGIKQAGNSETEPFAPFYDTDAALTSISNFTETNCMGFIVPIVNLSNFGANNLTSAEIHYHVNGENIQTYNWSGNLAFLESTEVELPQIDFTVIDENEVSVYVVNPNGTTDEFPVNDTIIKAFEAAVITPLEVKLMIKLDDNPEEITWEVLNSTGDVIFSGGPYTTAGAFIQETMDFEVPDCYIFNIYDTGGDGLQVPGFFALFYGGNNEIIAGTNFGSKASAQFTVGDPIGIDFIEQSHQVDIYPNPMNGLGQISFSLLEEKNIEIAVFNLTGQFVKNIETSVYGPGHHNIQFDMEDLQTGLYFIQTKIGNEIQTKRISVIK